MKNLEEIKRFLFDHKLELQEKFKINEIGIFGSYIKKTGKYTSDLDILVDFQTAVDLFTFVELKNFLAEHLGVKVDLVMKKALKPHIGRKILREVVMI